MDTIRDMAVALAIIGGSIASLWLLAIVGTATLGIWLIPVLAAVAVAMSAAEVRRA